MPWGVDARVQNKRAKGLGDTTSRAVGRESICEGGGWWPEVASPLFSTVLFPPMYGLKGSFCCPIAPLFSALCRNAWSSRDPDPANLTGMQRL